MAAKLEKRKAPGIVERHGRACSKREGRGCNCSPSYLAWVWSPRDGKKIYKTFAAAEANDQGRAAARAAARGWRRDAASQVANNKLRVAKPTTVEEEARGWIKRADRGEVRARGGKPFKPSVLRTYRRDLEVYVIPELGSIRVSQLRRREVQELLVDELVSMGRSGSRIRGVLNALRAVLRRPLQAEELQTDPTERLDLPTGERSRDRAASPAEAENLLAALDEADRALWATAFYAGLRRGELRALRWADIDDAVTEIRVQRGWDDEEGEIAPKSEKGTRRVPVASALRLLLLKHKASTGRRGDELVFGRTATAPFTSTHMRKRARGAWAATVVGAFLRGEPLELEPIGLHECRHTFVSMMAAAGVPLERIGDYVGHSSTYMTDRYRHLIEGQRENDGAMLDRYVTGARTGTQ